jgi:translation initiation factor IF-1
VSGDFITAEGVIVQVHNANDAVVDVELGEQTRRVLAKRAGRLRIRRLAVLAGDRFVVELSGYDMTRGRIVERLDPGRARRTPA